MSEPTPPPPPPPPPPPAPDLPLDAYLAGELDAAPAEVVRARLHATPERSARLAGVLAAVRGEHLHSRPSAEASAQRLLARIATHEIAPARRPFPFVAARPLRRVAAVLEASAVLALAIVGGRALWHTLSGDDTGRPRQTAQYHTNAGEYATVRLANGATMKLAPATSVTMTSGTITVSGEAYFTVAHAQDRPLTVRTTNATVRVLGTKFLVRHYPSDKASRVVVEDGRVALRSNAAPERAATPTVLTARMLALVADSGVTVTRGITVADYAGWTNGRLVFKDAPLRDVAAELARAYGVEIRVADSALAAQPMTMTAVMTQHTLPQLLDFIGQATDAHCEHIGEVFVLKAGRGTSDSSMPKGKTPIHTERSYGR